MVAVFSGSLFILMAAFIFKVVLKRPFSLCHNMPIVETMVLRCCLAVERQGCLSCFTLKASTVLTFFPRQIMTMQLLYFQKTNRRNNGAEGLSPFQLLCWSKLLRLYSFGGKIQIEPNFKITYFIATATNLVLNFSI